MRQNKSCIPSGLEKGFGITGGLLQIDRHPRQIEGLVEINAGTFTFVVVRLGRRERRSLIEKGAHIITITAASRNGPTAPGRPAETRSFRQIRPRIQGSA